MSERVTEHENENFTSAEELLGAAGSSKPGAGLESSQEGRGQRTAEQSSRRTSMPPPTTPLRPLHLNTTPVSMHQGIHSAPITPSSSNALGLHLQFSDSPSPLGAVTGDRGYRTALYGPGNSSHSTVLDSPFASGRATLAANQGTYTFPSPQYTTFAPSGPSSPSLSPILSSQELRDAAKNLPPLVPRTRRRSSKSESPLSSSSGLPSPAINGPLSTAAGIPSSTSAPAGGLPESLRRIRTSFALTPTTLLLKVLQSTESTDELSVWESRFYRDDNKQNIYSILGAIYRHSLGKALLRDWIRDVGMDIVGEIIDEEMDRAKPELSMTTGEVTSDYVDNFDLNNIMDPVKKITPTWCRILEQATSPSRRRGVEDIAQADIEEKRHRHAAQNMISAQAHYLRSKRSCKVQIGMGLFTYTMGASRSLVEVLHNSGFCRGYTTTKTLLEALELAALDKAAKAADNPLGSTHDNMNTGDKGHVEQRPDAPSKVRSGTFAIIYEAVNADLEDMKLAPIIENLRKACPLKITDLRMSREQKGMYNHQSTINIINILLKHKRSAIPDPSVYSNSPALQHIPRRPLPKGHKTKFYPLRTSTIEEASVEGNIKVHDDIFINQLKRSPEELSLRAFPCHNDQLTNARIRGAQELRADDINAWERRDVFQLAFGTFHMMMNLIWSLLHIHRGRVSDIGSLGYWISVLGKARLGSDRPDYHTLLATLTQVLEGLIINAWEMECGDMTLEEFLCSPETTPDKLLEVSKSILRKHATPSSRATEDTSPTVDDEPNSQAGSKKKKKFVPECDAVPHNTRLLIRDLLYVIELVSAVRACDFGRVEDILPDLACIFRGAGSTNYCLELLHFIFQVKEVWPPEFANIMRDMMLVNPTGLDGHGQGIDLNIEHLIGYIKALFMAKGIHADWDRIGLISSCINHLYILKRRIVTSFGVSYTGRTHHTPETTALLVQRVADKARENSLLLERNDRSKDIVPSHVIDARKVGYDKLASSGLASFNKKIQARKLGSNIDANDDEADSDNDGDVVPPLDLGPLDIDAE